MSVTSGLSDWLGAQGIWCPEGDGDTLRTAAGAWTTMGTTLTDIGGTLAAAATTLGATTTGGGTSAFGTYWSTWSGDTGYLAVAAGYCTALAAALTGFATDVDIASSAVLEGVEWAITQSNLTGGVPFTPGVIPDAVPAGVTQEAIDELKTAIEQFAVMLGAAAQAQAASPGVTAIDPAAPAATPVAAVTSTLSVSGTTPLAVAPDLGSLASTALDFGAGQGTVVAPDGAPVALPAPAPLPDATSSVAAASSDWAPPAVTPAAATVSTAAVSAPPVAGVAAMLASAFGVGKAVTRAVTTKAATPVSSGGFPGGGSGGSFSMPAMAKLPTTKLPTGTPVTVPPPSAAALAAEKAAATAAKAGASGEGSMPFMPMGMGGAGAGGGSEQEEAKRRKRRV